MYESQDKMTDPCMVCGHNELGLRYAPSMEDQRILCKPCVEKALYNRDLREAGIVASPFHGYGHEDRTQLLVRQASKDLFESKMLGGCGDTE
jgi:hypothetical protein